MEPSDVESTKGGSLVGILRWEHVRIWTRREPADLPEATKPWLLMIITFARAPATSLLRLIFSIRNNSSADVTFNLAKVGACT